MTALRELLAVFGALDTVVQQTGDPEVAAAVNQVLPGSPKNPGWYAEIEKFFFEDPRGTPRDMPDLGQTFENIVFDARENSGLTTPQKTRMLYGLSAIARVTSSASAAGEHLSTLDEGSPLRDLFIDVLSTLAPTGEEARSTPSVTPLDNAAAHVDELLALMANEFNRPGAFAPIVDFAVAKKLLPETAENVPQCVPYRRTVDGYGCVIVDTNFISPELSLDGLKAIVNPFNWDTNYPSFFCSMADYGSPRDQQWGRIIETVGFCGASNQNLRTALKFHPFADTSRPGEARLDYDLDDRRNLTAGGDGIVKVDRGWINMWADNTKDDPTAPGVRVATRKIVHIEGISTYAQERLVCITGYGTASAEFVFGNAASNFAGSRPFGFLGPENAANMPGTDQAKGPARPSGTSHFAPTAVRLWTDAVRGMSADYVGVADKWMAGKLTVDDLADYSATTTDRLIKAPFEFLKAMTLPRDASGGNS